MVDISRNFGLYHYLQNLSEIHVNYLFLSVQMQMGTNFEAQTECVSCWLSGDQGINYCMKLHEI
jgi:hypothetical protein